jgi:hypothetical protein
MLTLAKRIYDLYSIPASRMQRIKKQKVRERVIGTAEPIAGRSSIIQSGVTDTGNNSWLTSKLSMNWEQVDIHVPCEGQRFFLEGIQTPALAPLAAAAAAVVAMTSSYPNAQAAGSGIANSASALTPAPSSLTPSAMALTSPTLMAASTSTSTLTPSTSALHGRPPARMIPG